MKKLKKLILVIIMFMTFVATKSDFIMSVNAEENYSCSYNEDFYVEDGELLGYWGDDTKVIVPDGIKTIGEYAFAGDENVEVVVLPTSLTKIKEGAFSYCTNLEKITIPNTVTSIGSDTFSGCSSLKSIVLPSKLPTLNSYTFSDCEDLESVTLPSGLTSIGTYVFDNCRSLKSISIPKTVTKIGDYAFSACTSLTSVTLPDGLQTVSDGIFENCTNLTSVKLPTNLKSINHDAFYNCNKLDSLTIPKSVTYISSIAFPDYTNPNFKLYVTKGSYAESYAKNNYVPYKYTISTKIEGLKQSSNTTSSIKLSWNEISGATAYEVHRSTSKTGTYTKVKTLYGNSSTTFNDTKLKSGTIYYYKVRALKNTTKYSFSSVLASSTVCKSPVVSLSTKPNSIKVSWQKVSGASGYKIYRATSKSGKYSYIQTISGGSTLSYTNSKLTKNKTYYYKVKAYKTVNSKQVDSSYSTVKSIKCK